MKTSKSPKIIVETTRIALKAGELISKTLSNSRLKHEIISNPLILNEQNPIESLLSIENLFLITTSTSERTMKTINLLKSLYEHWVPAENIIISNKELATRLNKLIEKDALMLQKMSNLNAIKIINEKNDNDSESTKIDFNIDIREYNQIENNVGYLIYICDLMALCNVSSYWNQVIFARFK